MIRIIVFVGFIPILFSIVLSAQNSRDSICGKYIWAPMHNYIDSSVIVLQSNGRFIESTKRGYLSNKKWLTGRGKWELQGDTIILSKLYFISKSGDRRSIIPRRISNSFAFTVQHCLLYEIKNDAPRQYCKNYR